MSTRFPDHGLSLTAAGVALVTGPDGTITGLDAGGLYQRDVRVVAQMRFVVEGTPPIMLSRARTGASTDRLIYGHWSDAADPSAIVVRERSVGSGYTEQITIQCFREPLDMHIEVHLAPDGSPIYQLGKTPADQRHASVAETKLWAEGALVAGTTVTADVSVEPGDLEQFSWGLDLDTTPAPSRDGTMIRASDHRTQRALDHAAWDLEALTVIEPSTGRSFTAAGAPHFLAVFGRDSLCASLLALVADPHRALDTLEIARCVPRPVGRRHHARGPGGHPA